MRKVYIVVCGTQSDYRIKAVCAKREVAMHVIATQLNTYDKQDSPEIEEHDLIT